MKRPTVVTAERGRQVMVQSGGSQLSPADREPDFVDIDLEHPDIDGEHPPQKGTIFLGLCLGTIRWDGKRDFEEFAGCIQPSQLDELISCLTLARDRAAKIGLLGKEAKSA